MICALLNLGLVSLNGLSRIGETDLFRARLRIRRRDHFCWAGLRNCLVVRHSGQCIFSEIKLINSNKRWWQEDLLLKCPVGRCLSRDLVGHLHLLEGPWPLELWFREVAVVLVGVIHLDLFVVTLVVGGGVSLLGVRQEQTDRSLMQVRGVSLMVQEDAVGNRESAALGRGGGNICGQRKGYQIPTNEIRLKGRH